MKYVELKYDKENSSENDSVYIIVDKYDDELGRVYYYSKWRKYVFEPHESTFYDWKCLNEISDLIKELKK